MAVDDTQLGRPPRHYRPPTRRRGPITGVSMACTCGHGSADHTDGVHACSMKSCSCAVFVLWAPRSELACSSCGQPVDLDLDSGVPQAIADVARRRLADTSATVCTTCGDRELVDQERAEREAERAERVSRRRAASAMPAKWMVQRFATLDDDHHRRRALELAGEWGRGERLGLLLYGPVGRGKTAVAAAAANLRLEHGPLRWLSVVQLLQGLKMPFDSDEYSAAARMLAAGNARPALVLDDLDKLKPTEHAVTPLFAAINAWVEAELPLLVTLNRDLNHLEEWMPDTFGAAISSRLSGYCAISHVGGIDRRLAPAGARA